MKQKNSTPSPAADTESNLRHGSHRFYSAYSHLAAPFGNGWFGAKAEAFARFFGTPLFLGAQTLLVIFWIVANSTGLFNFDVYPFILLNLAFSVQAAYSAPLILLAQTRQADRDKAQAEADALHRETLSKASTERQQTMEQNTERLFDLLEQNTKLTEMTKQLSERIEKLTLELHGHLLQDKE